MADKHEIELFISENGEVKVHIKGIKGNACLGTLDSFAKPVGKKHNVNLTPEYYLKPDTTTKNQVRGS